MGLLGIRIDSQDERMESEWRAHCIQSKSELAALNVYKVHLNFHLFSSVFTSVCLSIVWSTVFTTEFVHNLLHRITSTHTVRLSRLTCGTQPEHHSPFGYRTQPQFTPDSPVRGQITIDSPSSSPMTGQANRLGTSWRKIRAFRKFRTFR